MNAIIGFSEILKRELLGQLGTEKYVEDADDIYWSARHLLPLLNDMRTARGDKLLSENALFSPELENTDAPAAEAELADLSSEQNVLQLRKLRQALQMAQAGVIRGQDVALNSRHLRNVFARLETLCKGAP